MGRSILVNALLLQEFGNCVYVDEIDDCQYELGFAAGNTFPIWEELASFVLDILSELDARRCTRVKGEYASPRALGVL